MMWRIPLPFDGTKAAAGDKSLFFDVFSISLAEKDKNK
jgi:hypothetical protein